MDTAELSELKIEILADDATKEELDRMTYNLLSAVREMDVERVELAKAGPAPEGAKAIDALTAGSLVMAVLPGMLPKVIDGIQAWAMRGSNRSVKFKGRIAGQAIEFEGSGEDLQRLLATLDKRGRKK
jgi:hypothetical protein